MTTQKRSFSNAQLGRLLTVVFSWPWLEILAEVWKLGHQLWRGMADEGIYEVLEHEMTLELMDKRGVKAKVKKRQKVRYLQNNIIAYQDQAWGDGELLLNYRCSPGKVVDRYRAAHKTILLISLGETKRRGNEDEFNIEWDFKNGFLKDKEFWATEVNHRTKKLKIQAIFPKTRPPLRAWLVESLRRRTHRIGPESKVKLPDGRWLAYWETDSPRLNEQYVLNWTW